RVAQDRAVLETAHHRRWNEDKWLAIGFGLHKGRDRHLADVEFELPHHRLEEPVRRLDVGKREGDARGFDLAALERQGVRIIVECGVQCGDGRVDAHGEPIALADTHTFWHIFPPARRACRPARYCSAWCALWPIAMAYGSVWLRWATTREWRWSIRPCAGNVDQNSRGSTTDQPRPPAERIARVAWSGPKSSVPSIERRSDSRVRARLTRLLMVPTAQSQMAAASS